eukprot:TRINITY_DN3310_c0_g1_i10.p1 TRINITY_DN3310_c0_g1~~TRINITY_DN3310_c0_g1_i10.p1  ORF type:complete len:711 (+),score=183.56 TRINITY_DN3310_c0_g1_i10:121-2253(+)
MDMGVATEAAKNPQIMDATRANPLLAFPNRKKTAILFQMSKMSQSQVISAPSSDLKHADSTPPSSPSAEDAEKRRQSHRNHLVKEILSTETSYVDALNIIVDEVLITLREMQPEMLNPQLLTRIFSNVEIIRNVQKEFLSQLQARLDDWKDGSLVGDIFLSLIPYFKSYTEYVSNCNTAMQVAQKVFNSNKKFHDFLQTLAKSKGRAHAVPYLADLLITPVQRLPRYELLLRDLIKLTNEEHNDYPILKEALEGVQSVAQHVNETKGESENTTKVVEIHNLIWGNKTPKKHLRIVKPSRRFIKDLRTRINDRQRHIYLFNDVFVICSFRAAGADLVAGKLKHRATVSLFNATVRDVSIGKKTIKSSSTLFDEGDGDDGGGGAAWLSDMKAAWNEERKELDKKKQKHLEKKEAAAAKHEWAVVIVDSTDKEIVIVFKDELEKDEWLGHFRRAIKLFTEKKKKLLNASTLPLHAACKQGNFDDVKKLVDQFVDAGDSSQVNKLNDKGRTAVYVAARQGSSQIIKYLVEVGKADPNIAAPGGLIPLDVAATVGHSLVVSYLATLVEQPTPEDEAIELADSLRAKAPIKKRDTSANMEKHRQKALQQREKMRRRLGQLTEKIDQSERVLIDLKKQKTELEVTLADAISGQDGTPSIVCDSDNESDAGENGSRIPSSPDGSSLGSDGFDSSLGNGTRVGRKAGRKVGLPRSLPRP